MTQASKLCLRYEFDAGSGVCLWAANAEAEVRYGLAVEVAALPLSTKLCEQLHHLIAWYDSALDWDNPGGASPWSAEERQRFLAAARQGLLALRRELPAEFEVTDALSA